MLITNSLFCVLCFKTMTKHNGPRLLCGPPVCDFCISIWSRPSRNSHSFQTGLTTAECCTEHSASKAGRWVALDHCNLEAMILSLVEEGKWVFPYWSSKNWPGLGILEDLESGPTCPASWLFDLV